MEQTINNEKEILSEINELLNECKCKKENFELDIEKKTIVSKNIDTVENCENDCGLITKITMYLITNDIDYDLFDDFSIRLNINN